MCVQGGGQMTDLNSGGSSPGIAGVTVFVVRCFKIHTSVVSMTIAPHESRVYF